MMQSHNPAIQRAIQAIEYPCTYSIWNLLKSTLRWKNYGFSGFAGEDYFIIWKYEHWRTGIFFPVIYGKADASGSDVSVLLNTRLNPIGKFFAVAICLFMSVVWFSSSRDFMPLTFRGIHFSLLFAGTFISIHYLLYRNYLKQLLKEVNAILKQPPENIHESNE
jgi:hypothetical protein